MKRLKELLHIGKVYEYQINTKHVFGGLELFTYQLAFGISFRILICDYSFMLRLYFGPFKLWLNFWKRERP